MASKPPFNTLRFAEPRVDVEIRPDGTTILRSPHPLHAYPTHMGYYLRRWAAEAPERHFLAERDGEDRWRTLTYREVLARVESLGQALLDEGLSIERPLMVLSENSIDVATLTLAGLYVGVPVVPVSPAYSLLSQDLLKIRAIHDQISPGLIYAREGDRYARAIAAIRRPGSTVVVGDGDVPSSIRFDELLRANPTRAVSQAFDRINPDQIAKILFTSGSTGEPKGVITTHRMLCSNQQSIAQCWPFLEDAPPIILDWLPWSHAFGANHNFNLTLRNGGTFFIDDGKPLPGLIEKTVRNLREVSPTLYFNAPRGFDMLLPFLEKDEQLRNSFFRRLDFIFYASAALPQNLWDRLENMSIAARGERVRMVSSWGATETTCTATSVYFDIERAGVIGIPAPGVEVMLKPSLSKLELRVRGPIVTPGYWNAARPSRRPPSTTKASTRSAMPAGSKIRAIRAGASSSMAVSRRTSSCCRAPGCIAARCAWERSQPARRRSRTPSSPGTTARASACSCSSTRPRAVTSPAIRRCRWSSSRPMTACAPISRMAWPPTTRRTRPAACASNALR